MSDASISDRDPLLAAYVGLAFSLGLDTKELEEIISSEGFEVTEADVLKLLDLAKQLTEGKLP